VVPSDGAIVSAEYIAAISGRLANDEIEWIFNKEQVV